MRSKDEVRDRLRELRRIVRTSDYYDPYTTHLRGEIAALEWALAEREPPAYDHVRATDESR
jgi:hypothetical protein